jgi:hypothetical protein
MKGNKDRWWNELNDEDRAFIKRFLLASGSLKDLANSYGISYPTVRIRMNRLIEKIQVIEDESPQSPFERTVRLLAAEGRLDAQTMKILLRAHETQTSTTQDETE